ncbi:hypothetical protein [Burkholderia sp. Z1]|uniref:hypothetical protein n=1 Tax=Burkholderia sp. Z1 TaxID=2759039 RepID=UPI0018690865|nr:hypothetical protein [Burkholderia sp. Z1]
MATTLDEEVLPEIFVKRFRISGGQVTSGKGHAPAIQFAAAFHPELDHPSGSLQGSGTIVWAHRPNNVTRITIGGNYTYFPSKEEESASALLVRSLLLHVHGYVGGIIPVNKYHGVPPALFPVLDLSSLIPQGSKTGTASYTSVDPQNPEEKITVSDAKITEL